VCEALTGRLAENIEALADRETLQIAELRAEGVLLWRVQRDQNGTPCARHSLSPEPWSSLYNDGVLSGEEFSRVTRPRPGSRIVYVAASPADRRATETLAWLKSVEPDAVAYQCAMPVEELLRDVISRTPLTRWYDLVVLARSRSGRLTLLTQRLFPPGAESGDREAFTIQCSRSDSRGTAFAVVSSKSKERGFQLVSVQSAKIPPGTYKPVAELRRPGVVDIHNLPAQLREDNRSWVDLITSVPDRLQPVKSSHLLCLVEVSGTADQVSARLDRTRQLLEFVASEVDGNVSVSVISYGSHAVDVGDHDDTPQVVIWAATAEAATSAIERLGKHGASPMRYSRAAQLECALAEAVKRIDDDLGRLTLVTICRRPPFPPKVDTSEIIPCPKKHDWRIAIRRLSEHLGATFGAIHDNRPDDPIWKQLGANASAELSTGAFDPRSFAAELGLTSPNAEVVPFPLISAEED
jgi:hypothetical protein